MHILCLLDKLRDREFLLKVVVAILLLSFGVAYAWIAGRFGLTVAMCIAAIPSLMIFFWYLATYPKIGIYTIFIFSYFLMWIYRYYNDFPLGGVIDILIVVTFLFFILKNIFERIDFSPLASMVVVLALVWLAYGVLQIANPNAPGIQGWIYAIRGYNIHMWCILALSMLLLRTERDINTFIWLWSAFTVLAALKGIYQYYFGFNATEWAWLEAGEKKTHILPTGVRIFSFMSDASQFGATMGHSTTVFLVLALKNKTVWRRVYFAIVAALALVGMLLSGTRGALFIPFFGAVFYIIYTKQYKVIVWGALAMVVAVALIKFTDIGNNHYPIRRMRSAFNMNDPSLLVRFKHQKMFREYNEGKPFGSGVGSSYHTAVRLYPGTYLSTFSTDSWFWAIFAEQGIVGICIYGIVVLYILIYGSYICMFKIKDEILAQKMKAFMCGFAGLLVASYANEILGQFPTSTITYITIGFVFTAAHLPNKQTEVRKNG